MGDGWWAPDCVVFCGCARCDCPKNADIVNPNGTALCGCCLADCPDRHPESA